MRATLKKQHVADPPLIIKPLQGGIQNGTAFTHSKAATLGSLAPGFYGRPNTGPEMSLGCSYGSARGVSMTKAGGSPAPDFNAKNG